MAYRIEFAADAEADLAVIFDFLVDAYIDLGDAPDAALDRAAGRVRTIRRTADRLATGPHRGARDDDLGSGIRHVTMDRAVYYFRVEDKTDVVAILAIFTDHQDHRLRMLKRLLGD